jgi:phosphatidylglycerol---prolipoprotein diacylglyceryl transferase
MYPNFGRILGEPIPAYFTFIIVGFTAATWVGVRWAKRTGLDHEVVIDLGLISLLVGVAGARILHVLVDGYFWDYVHLCSDPSKVIWRTVTTKGECLHLHGIWDKAGAICHPAERDCFAWAAFWNGGLTYYGGLIAAVGVDLWFLKREGFPLLKTTDMAGMAIPVGLFFGRLGCFFGGCCFGLPTTSGMGVSFPAGSAASYKQFEQGILPNKELPSLAVFPTQLYEAAGCLLIAAFVAIWLHPRKRFDGEVFCAFILLYSILRFALEYLRADDRGAWLGLSTSQLISLVVATLAIAVAAVLAKRAKVALSPA